MKTIYIILIIVIIVCLLSSSSAAFLFIRKKTTQQNNAITEYNKNIDDYNIKYNMNYQNNKLYYTEDLRKMLSTMATVIDDPIKEEITVNNKKIIIYNTKIEYKIVNYLDIRTGKINSLTDARMVIKKKQDTIIDIPVKVIADIITTKEIEKDDMFTVYYNYDIDRTAPPFLSEKYVTYLNKL